MAILAKFDPPVTGESQVTAHEGWIDVLSVSEGISSPVSRDGGGLSGGKSDLSAVTMGVSSGAHIADMVKGGTGGKHFNSVTLEFLLQTGTQVEVYRRLTLNEVYISHWGYSAAGEHKGSDAVVLEATKAKWEYLQQSAEGGLEAKGSATYDMKTGVTS
jgi:type VI secretion system secreted protein Hcp